jgi:hypothetical protein
MIRANVEEAVADLGPLSNAPANPTADAKGHEPLIVI